MSCLCQVPTTAGEWSDSGVHSGSVLQAEIQPATKIPSPALSPGWPGTKTHIPSLGGECWHLWLGAVLSCGPVMSYLSPTHLLSVPSHVGV